jgi:hypothetical protein
LLAAAREFSLSALVSLTTLLQGSKRQKPFPNTEALQAEDLPFPWIDSPLEVRKIDTSMRLQATMCKKKNVARKKTKSKKSNAREKRFS